jgi:hypothetical protein
VLSDVGSLSAVVSVVSGVLSVVVPLSSGAEVLCDTDPLSWSEELIPPVFVLSVSAFLPQPVPNMESATVAASIIEETVLCFRRIVFFMVAPCFLSMIFILQKNNTTGMGEPITICQN